MYSKTYGRGYLPRAGEPAYRQPPRTPMQVPSNYSGHAIVDGEERPLGVMPSDGGGEASLPVRDTPTPRFDGLPRVSDLSDASRRREHLSLPLPLPPMQEEPSEPDLDGEGSQDEPSAEETVAAGSTPSRSLFDAGRFPFGRGIGSDELLILGLILLLLRESGDSEDRGDLDETVILLGLILLLG